MAHFFSIRWEIIHNNLCKKVVESSRKPILLHTEPPCLNNLQDF